MLEGVVIIIIIMVGVVETLHAEHCGETKIYPARSHFARGIMKLHHCTWWIMVARASILRVGPLPFVDPVSIPYVPHIHQ